MKHWVGTIPTRPAKDVGGHCGRTGMVVVNRASETTAATNNWSGKNKNIFSPVARNSSQLTNKKEKAKDVL